MSSLLYNLTSFWDGMFLDLLDYWNIIYMLLDEMDKLVHEPTKENCP